MIWCAQRNHDSDGYFCLVDVKRYSKQNRYKIIYPNQESAMRHVSYGALLHTPIHYGDKPFIDFND